MDPHVVFTGLDAEGYLLVGGGIHVGVFRDQTTGNTGWFFSLDLGAGLGGNVGFSGGVASNLSSFQGPTSVVGAGYGPVSGNYVSQPGQITKPVAVSAGPGVNFLPPPLSEVPASAHASKSNITLFKTSLPPCHKM